MLKIIYIAFIINAFLFSACENSTEVSTGVPYKEYTVIDAELNAFNLFDGVRITHTLPLNIEYDIHKAEIRDALAYITEAGTRVIPLHYTSEGLYKPAGNLVIQARTQYELFVKTGNKTIYSKTLVPDVPEISDVTNTENNYLSAEVTAKPGEVYGAVWIISTGIGQVNEKADDFFSIESANGNSSNVLVRTADIPSPYNTYSYSNFFYIQVYAFDAAYKNYFITKSGSKQINNTFTSGGGPVIWNVYGDNVIGLFIGTAEGNEVLWRDGVVEGWSNGVVE